MYISSTFTCNRFWKDLQLLPEKMVRYVYDDDIHLFPLHIPSHFKKFFFILLA